MNIKQSGFTLVELLVTLAISGTLVAGVGQILLQSKQTYKTQQALSHMMEDGRYVLETLTKETRRMGYLRNKTASESSLGEAVGDQRFLFVLDDGGDGSGVLGSGVTLKRGEYIRGDYNAYSFDGTPNNVNKLLFRYQLNDACDLGDCADTSSATSPCTRNISLDPGENPAVDRHVVSIYLYVELDDTNTPVLYCKAKRDIVSRIILDPTNSSSDMWLATTAKPSVNKALPLLSNVERLLVLYGVDVDNCDPTGKCDHDNATNFYRRADDISTASCGLEADGVTPTSCWEHITSIRLYVVLRSEETQITQNASSYLIDGKHVDADVPSDRRLYRVFSTTITPRVNNAPSI